MGRALDRKLFSTIRVSRWSKRLLIMKTKTDRRTFIRSTAMAGGALAATGPFTPRTPGLSVFSTRPLSSYDRVVRQLIARMTLAEKVGQMTQAEQNALQEGDIEK